MVTPKSIAFDEEELSRAAAGLASSANYGRTSADFVDKLRAGDARAFDNLITRYSGEIFGLLVRLTGDAEEAADLTQETFLRALKAIRGFRGDADLRTWLYRIAVNQSRNRFRWWKRRRRENTVSFEARIGDSEKSYAEILSDGTENPEDIMLRLERERRLRKALDELPASYREAIVLRDIEGLSYEDVAAALEINIGTVKSRIARGREELRKLLVDF